MDHKTADCLHDFEILEIEVKLQLQGLDLKINFLDENS